MDSRWQDTWSALEQRPPAELPHRHALEQVFDADLSGVRAWTGGARELHGVSAEAATRGENVVFAGSAPDLATVAHEVAHVLQFRQTTTRTSENLPWQTTDHGTRCEREASSAAARAVAGFSIQVSEPAVCAVHCLAPGEEPARAGIKEADVPITAIDPKNEKYAKRIRSTVAEMTRSSEIIVRNTAHRILDAGIVVKLIEDLAVHPDPAAVLSTGGMSPDQVKQALRDGNVYDIPGGNAPKYIPNSAKNFYAQEITNTVFIRGLGTREEIKVGLLHEASHALNPDWSTLEQLFDTEARAYYVADVRDSGGNFDPHGRSGETLRIALAKENTLQYYPDLKNAYQTDPAFKAFVDNWKPTGNLVNAPESP